MMTVRWEGHLTDKSDHRVGRLNTILAGIFKGSNARASPAGCGMLKFRVDRRITTLL